MICDETKIKEKKEPRKVMTFGKNIGHYINKIFILQVKTKGSIGTIHYSAPDISLFIYSLTNHCS